MKGRKFGRLTVIGRAGTGTRGQSWLCQCICGTIVRLSTSQLIKGGYISCGKHTTKSLKRKPVPKELRRRYPLTVRSWEAMLSRCHYTKKKQPCYKDIQICEQWFSFANFLQDMGPRPSIEYSIDREDPDGNYSPSNCRWLTKKENSSRIRMNLTPKRNQKVSEGVKRAHAEGKILTPEARVKIGKGGAKRVGRRLQKCQQCGLNAYLSVCQRCRIKEAK
jgi:hypothetical protein